MNKIILFKYIDSNIENEIFFNHNQKHYLIFKNVYTETEKRLQPKINLYKVCVNINNTSYIGEIINEFIKDKLLAEYINFNNDDYKTYFCINEEIKILHSYWFNSKENEKERESLNSKLFEKEK